MRFLRRQDETLNEQLLREAGYAPDGTKKVVARPQARHTIPWKFTTTAEDPYLKGDAYEFTTLPDGSLIVDEDCEEDLSRLADALEREVKPPYRAGAMRQNDHLWLVSAREIDVAEFAADGDVLDFTSVGGERTYAVDGRTMPETDAPSRLVARGEVCGDDFVVHAVRLDGDVWDVTADPL